jgi:hypothetical protein
MLVCLTDREPHKSYVEVAGGKYHGLDLSRSDCACDYEGFLIHAHVTRGKEP